MKPKRRKIVRWVAGALGVVLLLLATPLWFPWLLAPAAKKAGLHYGSYVRQGYSHFVLKSVAYKNAGIRFDADRVQALVPTVWALNVCRSASVTYVQASNWTLAVTASTKPSSQPSTS